MFSVDRIESLYSVALDGPDLAVLIRHRAALFGIGGGMLTLSAFLAWLRPVARWWVC
jgi:hypothetical protein